MQCITQTAGIPLPKPDTFAGLMELYENNYLKISKLCGNFNKIHEHSVSRAGRDLDLYLRVIERSRYTITLNLTYRFYRVGQSEYQALPDVLVKVYFDAMQAEVLQRSARRGMNSRSAARPNLNNKWQNNRFLFKWLSFCLHQGHCFPAQE